MANIAERGTQPLHNNVIRIIINREGYDTAV